MFSRIPESPQNALDRTWSEGEATQGEPSQVHVHTPAVHVPALEPEPGLVDFEGARSAFSIEDLTPRAEEDQVHVHVPVHVHVHADENGEGEGFKLRQDERVRKEWAWLSMRP